MIAKPKSLYAVKGHHYAGYRMVKIGKWAWGVLRFYSSKSAAEAGLAGYKWLLKARRGFPTADKRLVKTTRGWAVVQQTPVEQYRIKSTDPRLVLVD